MSRDLIGADMRVVDTLLTQIEEVNISIEILMTNTHYIRSALCAS
jgi:hypothetical protein